MAVGLSEAAAEVHVLLCFPLVVCRARPVLLAATADLLGGRLLDSHQLLHVFLQRKARRHGFDAQAPTSFARGVDFATIISVDLQVFDECFLFDAPSFGVFKTVLGSEGARGRDDARGAIHQLHNPCIVLRHACIARVRRAIPRVRSRWRGRDCGHAWARG